MAHPFRCFFLSALCILVWVSPLQADEVPVPKKKVPEHNSLKRAKVTEVQASNQLKYMMVKGFERMEREIVQNGSFPPFGLTLSPDGEFKAVIPSVEQKLPNQVVLIKLAESMEAIAQTRAMWAVGLMYIRAIQRDDGSYAQRIIVMTEHIAGWAKHWAYPFKVEGGEMKLGMPTETSVDPIYYVNKNK